MLRSPGRPRSDSESCGIREAGHRCARRTVPRGWSAAADVLGSGTRGPQRGVAFGHHDDSASAIGRVRFGRRTCRLDRRRSVFVRALDSARRACPTFVDRSIRSFAGASVEHARTGRLSMVECLRRGGEAVDPPGDRVPGGPRSWPVQTHSATVGDADRLSCRLQSGRTVPAHGGPGTVLRLGKVQPGPRGGTGSVRVRSSKPVCPRLSAAGGGSGRAIRRRQGPSHRAGERR